MQILLSIENMFCTTGPFEGSTKILCDMNDYDEAGSDRGFSAQTLIDTHCHPQIFYRQGRLATVLEAARRANVSHIVAIGTGPDDWDDSIALAKQESSVSCTLGLHPSEVSEPESQLELLRSLLATKPPCVAIGEVGLDYYHISEEPTVRKRQQELQAVAFSEQIRLAKQYDLPLVVHARSAFDETLRLLEAGDVDWAKVVFHCFCETPEKAQQLLDRGTKVSFTGIITYKNAAVVRESLRLVGLDRLMLETDAPWLAPHPLRGQENVPAYLLRIAEYCAQFFSCSLEQVAEHSTRNARAFFACYS
ncbi:TPA: TatD family deoxyribonuclease [Candidatus Edwardsbacteria bacterium]|nr:TatD family deoxyribonuclease [Candidatus Edwardsbacteria bacterium]